MICNIYEAININKSYGHLLGKEIEIVYNNDRVIMIFYKKRR